VPARRVATPQAGHFAALESRTLPSRQNTCGQRGSMRKLH
jgi:hypothetical protein